MYKSTRRSHIVSHVRQGSAPNGSKWHRHSNGQMAVNMAVPILLRYDRFRNNTVISHKYGEPTVAYSWGAGNVVAVVEVQLPDGVGLAVRYRISSDVLIG